MSETILKMRLRAFHSESRRANVGVLVPTTVDEVVRAIREGLVNVLSVMTTQRDNYQKTHAALHRLGYLYAMGYRFLSSSQDDPDHEDVQEALGPFMDEIDTLAMSCFKKEEGFKIIKQPEVASSPYISIFDGEVFFKGKKTSITATGHNGVYLVVLAGLNFVKLGEVPHKPTPSELYEAVMKIHAPNYLGETVYTNVWLVAPGELMDFLDRTIAAMNAPVEIGDLPKEDAKAFFNGLSDAKRGGPITQVSVGSADFEVTADQIDKVVAALIGEDAKTDMSVAPDGTITRMVEASRMASITLANPFMEKVVEFVDLRKQPEASEEERKALREKALESFWATVQNEAKFRLQESLAKAVRNAITLLRQGLITKQSTKTLFLSVETALRVPVGLALPTDNRIPVPHIAGDLVTTVVTGEALRSGDVILNYQFTFKD